MPPSPSVLIVEDDEAIGAELLAALAGASYRVQWARTAAEAHRLVASGGPLDLVLLDLGLPDGDGLDVCRRLSQQSRDVVVIVVTARDDETFAVQALDAGADDYITKPFRLGELLARVRANMRRHPARDEEVVCGPVRLDLRARRAFVHDAEVEFRPKEFELLTVLVSHAGTAVRRERLMDEVWDADWSMSTKTLDVHVANVRRKLADAGDRWERISTVRGFGYRWEVD